MDQNSFEDEIALFRPASTQSQTTSNRRLQDANEKIPVREPLTGTSVMELESTHSSTKAKGKIGRHFKRFWKFYLIGIVVVLAIFLPLMFVKIIPAIAQSMVNNADFPIYSTTLKAVSNNQVDMGIQAAVDLPSGISARLDTFDLLLHNPDTPEFSPYVSLTVPGQRVKGMTALNITEQRLTITNAPEFVKLMQRMFQSNMTTVSFRGDTTAHLGAIKAPVHIEKTVSIAGLNQLSGLKIESLELKTAADPDGSNIVGNITFPNPSTLTLGLGNVTVNTFASDVLVASVSVYDVLLPPGGMTMPFRGRLFLATLVANFATILGYQATAIGQGRLQLGLSGNNTMVNGEHITYIEEVLNNVMLFTDVPIGSLLGSLGGALTAGGGTGPSTSARPVNASKETGSLSGLKFLEGKH